MDTMPNSIPDTARANYVGFNEGNLSKIASYTSNPPKALSAPCNTLKTA
jgi:hypothetical protein